MVTGAAPIQRQPGNEGLNRQDQRWRNEIIPGRSQLGRMGYTESVLKNRHDRGVRDDRFRTMYGLRNDALSRYSHRERHGQPNKGPAQPEQEARALSTSQRVNGALNRAHSKDRPNSDRSAAARGIKQSIQNPNTSN
ncbi:hypothetical protein BASA81_014161 [Batrachochytrium salamandrivorans]|nr:hypothetical protein BASA81_014161 [Batrachochytrium salamandrivorans]